MRWHEVPSTERPIVSVVLPPKPCSDKGCPYLTFSAVFSPGLTLSPCPCHASALGWMSFAKENECPSRYKDDLLGRGYSPASWPTSFGCGSVTVLIDSYLFT